VGFATRALSPAKIARVTIIDANERHMEVIVDDTQLSLAIGKKGQNVRLAAKLLSWKIDIKSEEEKRQEVESAMQALVVPGAPVSVLIDHGLGEKLAEKLLESGVATVEKLGSMTPEQLEEIQGIGPKIVERIQLAVNSYYGQFEGSVEAAAQPAEPIAAEAPSEPAETEAAAPSEPAPAEAVAPSEPIETAEVAPPEATSKPEAAASAADEGQEDSEAETAESQESEPEERKS
jgi:N utilization substance protein A